MQFNGQMTQQDNWKWKQTNKHNFLWNITKKKNKQTKQTKYMYRHKKGQKGIRLFLSLCVRVCVLAADVDAWMRNQLDCVLREREKERAWLRAGSARLFCRVIIIIIIYAS